MCVGQELTVTLLRFVLFHFLRMTRPFLTIQHISPLIHILLISDASSSVAYNSSPMVPDFSASDPALNHASSYDLCVHPFKPTSYTYLTDFLIENNILDIRNSFRLFHFLMTVNSMNRQHSTTIMTIFSSTRMPLSTCWTILPTRR
jgi:hypothetical protein